MQILLIESFLVFISAGFVISVGRYFPLDAFKTAVIGFGVFNLLSLAVLKFILRSGLLIPGKYSRRDDPKVIRRWRLFDFIARNNLFFWYPNALLPINLRTFVCSFLGADIAKGMITIGGAVTDPYLVSLGDNTMLGQDAVLSAAVFDGNELILGKISVGEGSVVGARTVVMPDVIIGKYALVKAMSLVPQGTRIGDNEVWGGVPARKLGESVNDQAPDRFTNPSYVALCAFTQTVILGGAGIATWAWARYWGGDLFISLVVFYVLQVIFSLLVYSLVLYLYPMKEGVFSYHRDRWVCYRWNLLAYLWISNLFLHFQRNLLPPVLRTVLNWFLGAHLSLKKNMIAASGSVLDPFFVTVGEGTILGYDAMLLPHAVTVDQLYLRPVEVGSGVMLGARSMVMPGASIGRNAVIEPLSLVTSGTKVPDGEVWGGVPARKLGEVGLDQCGFVRHWSDVTVTLVLEAGLAAASLWVVRMVGNVHHLSLFSCCLIAYASFILFSIAVTKLIRICYPFTEGEFSEREDPVAFFCWKLHAFICVDNLFLHYQNFILPPVLRTWLLASLGCRVPLDGSVTVNSIIGDPYFLTIGRKAILGYEALILTCQFHQGSLVLRRVHIGEGAVVGDRAVIMPGVVIGDQAHILPQSLVEEGTHVPPHETWGGIPARKIQP